MIEGFKSSEDINYWQNTLKNYYTPIELITIPNTITLINHHTFGDYALIIPISIKDICKYLFSNCHLLAIVIQIQ